MGRNDRSSVRGSNLATKKKAQKQKPGKVLRLDQDTWNYIQERKASGERYSDLLRREIGLPPKGEEPEPPEDKFTLPSLLFDSVEEARGEALYRSVKEKIEPEKPISVRKRR